MWLAWALSCFAGPFGPTSRILTVILRRLADSMSMRPSWPPPRMPTTGREDIWGGIVVLPMKGFGIWCLWERDDK